MSPRSTRALPLLGVLSIAIACSSSSTKLAAPPLGSSGTTGTGGTCPTPPATETCDLAKGLTGWWRAEDTPDTSIGAANGVWTGTADYLPGKVCLGFAFDGKSYVRAPFTQTGPLTIDFWASSSPAAEGIFDAAFASGDDAVPPYFQVDSDGTGNYRVYAETEIPIGPIPTGTFQHIAITYDGTTVLVYLNGKSVGSADWTKNMPLEFATLKIGSNRKTSNFFDGVVDELHIWNRALSAAEIGLLFQISGVTLCP